MMTNRVALTMAILTCSAAAHAQDADLWVQGTLRPEACTITLGDDGRFDLGTMAVSSMNEFVDTPLPDQHLDFRLQCAAPTAIALQTTDLRAGSASGTGPVGYRFGLGMTTSGERIGNTHVRLENLIVDGVPARTIYSANQGGNWTGGPDIFNAFRPDWWSSFATAGTTVPLALQSVDAVLRTVAVVAPRAGLTMDDDVSLDGAVLIELKYL